MQTAKRNGKSASVVDVHFRDLKKYPPLSKVEFDNMVSEMRNGSESAFQKLMLHNARFVIKIAHKYCSPSVPQEDLIQAGYLGLARAIRKWDPDRKNTFTSYAVWWIRLFMYQELSGSKMRDGVIYLDKPRNDLDDSGSLHDLIPDQAPMQDEVLEQGELSEIVRGVVDELPAREREFIIARYGVGGVAPQTLKEIGKDHGYSKETARLVIERAENSLRYLFQKKLPTGIKNTIL